MGTRGCEVQHVLDVQAENMKSDTQKMEIHKYHKYCTAWCLKERNLKYGNYKCSEKFSGKRKPKARSEISIVVSIPTAAGRGRE